MKEITVKVKEKAKQYFIKLLQLKKRNQTLIRIMEISEVMKTINGGSSTINDLINTGETATAIEILDSMDKVIAEKLSPINTAMYI